MGWFGGKTHYFWKHPYRYPKNDSHVYPYCSLLPSAVVVLEWVKRVPKNTGPNKVFGALGIYLYTWKSKTKQSGWSFRWSTWMIPFYQGAKVWSLDFREYKHVPRSYMKFQCCFLASNLSQTHLFFSQYHRASWNANFGWHHQSIQPSSSQ